MLAARIVRQPCAAHRLAAIGHVHKASVFSAAAPHSLLARQEAKQRPAFVVPRSQGTVAGVHDSSRHFTMERYWSAGMAALFPAAYFIHHPVVDYALAIAIGLHVHWGFYGVAGDYARPYVMGEFLSKCCKLGVYGFSAALIASMLLFNYNDVGITKGFEMIWSI